MQQTQLTIRIDQKLKNKTMAQAKKMGLNLSALTKMFYSSFITNNNVIKINEEAIFDEALKSDEVRKTLEMLADAVIKKYPADKKIKSAVKF